MKRYKRGIVCLPDSYGRRRVEMNIYKQESEHIPFRIPSCFVNWEGEWQEVTYRSEYGEWEFYYDEYDNFENEAHK